MKDRRFVWFTLILSLLVGGAAAFSLDPSETHKTLYPFIDARTGKVFEAEIYGRDQKSFESLLTKDALVLSKGTAGRAGALPQYYLLETRQMKEVRPYAARFARGFLFVWMIYVVIAYLIKHLIIKEYKQTLTKKRRKTRRKK